MMRKGGSGAVAVCLIGSQGIPAFPSLGLAALRSLHLPCELPEHPWVSSRHLPVSRGIPWYPAQAPLFPSGDRVRRRWAAVQRCSFGSEPRIKGPQRYVVPEPGGAVSSKALIHRELTLPARSRRELFEGCGLPGILSAQVLSVLPQPSQRQHKSRKVCFAFWLLHQKYPLLGGCILSQTGVYVLLFMMLYRFRRRNDF